MDIYITERILIHACKERVFEFISNLERHLLWVNGLTFVSAGGPLTTGMHYTSTNAGLGQELPGKHEVLDVQPGKSVELWNHTGPLISTIKYELIAKNGATEASCSIKITSSHVAFGLAGPLVESLARGRLVADLENLKMFSEAKS